MTGQFNVSLSDYGALGVEGIFYVLVLIFVIHAVVLGYHWFSYGSSRSMSLAALAVYLAGGAVFLMTMASAMLLM